MDKPSINDLVAEEIRVLLARRRMSASDLARQTGMTQRAISRRLTGEKVIDVDDLAKIAEALGVEAVELLPRISEGTVVFAKSRRGQTTVAKPARAKRPRPFGPIPKRKARESTRRPVRLLAAHA